MSRLFIVSNRLPISVMRDGDSFTLQQSVGGLATGLTSIRKKRDVLWFGWPGIASDELDTNQQTLLREQLKDQKLHPVWLNNAELQGYYHGYANTTLWPICHYFIEKTKQNMDEFLIYQRVNRHFYETLKPHLENNSTVWIHDYQLMLLPKMIRDDFPTIKIGYFHHIPFPSFELFRLLSTKVELLEGLLGADLIGFHTYDYVRHFLSSVNRILHLNRQLFTIQDGQRSIHVDAFPMGIDVDFFQKKPFTHGKKDQKVILSVDRLDYTKGILERLEGYSVFLQQHPSYHGKVKLDLIIAPSRELLESYDQLKESIEKKISQINGKYATPTWMPIWYQYQAMQQEDLMLRYHEADILLVTPLRDGMNLIAKEYLATRTDLKGALILSETAGASGELAEAFIINPTNPHAIAEAIKTALETPKSVLMTKNRLMLQRIRRTDVHYWVAQFLKRLTVISKREEKPLPKLNFPSFQRTFLNAKKPLFVFDYDGTLMPLQSHPHLAKPNEKVHGLLKTLKGMNRVTTAIVSGREIKELIEWFKGYPFYLSGQHGAFIKHPNGQMIQHLDTKQAWKSAFKTLLYRFSDQMPGSFIEDKQTSLAFHYRLCEPDMVSIRLGELFDALESLKGKSPLHILQGHKVIEIKDSRIDKGQVVRQLLNEGHYDFVLIAGDDKTDEAMFDAIPEAYSFHIGHGITHARYVLPDVESFYRLLSRLFSTSSFLDL